jgi:hypothetical protein
MSKRKLCILVVLVVFAIVTITPMATSANTFAASSIRGIGASFGAAAHVGPVSTANTGSITLSGTGRGHADAGPGTIDAISNAFTFGPAAAFGNGICIRGVGGTSDTITIGLGGFGFANAGTFPGSC